MTKHLLIISILTLSALSSSFALASRVPSRWMQRLECSTAMPFIFSPQSSVKLEATHKENARIVYFKKNNKTSTKKLISYCSMQASILTCKWKTGKIKIDTTSRLYESGFPIMNTTVGEYYYYPAKTTIYRTLINKVEKVRCRIN